MAAPTDLLNAFRLKTYKIALLLGFVAGLINFLYNARVLKGADPFQGMYLLVMAACCLCLLFVLRRGKVHQSLVEGGMCLLAAGSLLSRLYYGLYFGNPNFDASVELAVIATWFPLTYILYYLLLKSRTATLMAWLSGGALIAISLPHMVPNARRGFAQDETFILLQLYIAGPVYIIFLSVLSMLKERYALALTQATLMTELATYDALTGLRNRRHIEESLPRLIKRALRDGTPVGIIMLDIDHFKRFNDRFGHEAGDAVLRAVGKFLPSHVRSEDIVCRYGGEEFLVIMPGARREIALQRAEQIRAGVTALQVDYEDQTLGAITLSLGVAIFPDDGPAGPAVLQAADIALYQSKRAGRNRVTEFAGNDLASHSIDSKTALPHPSHPEVPHE